MQPWSLGPFRPYGSPGTRSCILRTSQRKHQVQAEDARLRPVLVPRVGGRKADLAYQWGLPAAVHHQRNNLVRHSRPGLALPGDKVLLTLNRLLRYAPGMRQALQAGRNVELSRRRNRKRKGETEAAGTSVMRAARGECCLCAGHPDSGWHALYPGSL